MYTFIKDKKSILTLIYMCSSFFAGIRTKYCYFYGRIAFMRIVKQKEFDSFSCAADKCPDNCCGGWLIEIDDDTLQSLREYKGPLEGAIDKAVDFEASCIRMNEEGRCELLNEKGLCRLVLEKGEDFISQICHLYPRHVEEYEGIREWSISLSCPVAAKMLIDKKEPSEYTVTDNDDPDPLEDDFDDFDVLLFTKLEDSRDVIFDILNNRSISIYARMKMILKFTHTLQEMLDDDMLFDMDDLIEKARKAPKEVLLSDSDAGFRVFDDPYALIGYINDNSAVLYRLERLKADWTEELTILADMKDKFTDIGSQYRDAVESLDGSYHEIVLENVLHTFIYTYYLGAVYDDCIYEKASMSVFCTLLIDLIYMSVRICDEKRTGIDAFIRVAYRFAKEIEHSDINLNMMEEFCTDLFL